MRIIIPVIIIGTVNAGLFYVGERILREQCLKQELIVMAKNERRRQQKLMKKRRKDKNRRKTQAGIYLPEADLERKRIMEARQYPIHECLIVPGWRESGLAQILLSRLQPDGNLVAGMYMVDILCLGLKNTFAHANVSKYKYITELRDRMAEADGIETCSIDLAHTIIYGGIDYAGQFGFQPQRDFKLSRHVLEERDSFQMKEDVEFGREGKPRYISGPNDDATKITRQLEAIVGEGNFDFIIGAPAGG